MSEKNFIKCKNLDKYLKDLKNWEHWLYCRATRLVVDTEGPHAPAFAVRVSIFGNVLVGSMYKDEKTFIHFSNKSFCSTGYLSRLFADGTFFPIIIEKKEPYFFIVSSSVDMASVGMTMAARNQAVAALPKPFTAIYDQAAKKVVAKAVNKFISQRSLEFFGDFFQWTTSTY